MLTIPQATMTQNIHEKRDLSMKDAIKIEKWIFMLLITFLGFMCSRELSRLSTSIENLTKTQNDQMILYTDLKLELREFKVEMRTLK